MVSSDLFREPDGGCRFFIGVAVGTIIAATGLGLFVAGQDFFLFFLGSFLATLSLAEVSPTDQVRVIRILRMAAVVCLVMSVVVFLL